MRPVAAILETTGIDAAACLPTGYVYLYNKISGAKFARVKCNDYPGEKMSTLSTRHGDVSPFGLSWSKPLHPSTGSGRTAFLSTRSRFSSFPKWSREYAEKFPACAFAVPPTDTHHYR